MLAARHRVFSDVLAARKANLITARAGKNKRTARMLANARKDHSIPLILNTDRSGRFALHI